jgi:hypothetical protein
MKLHLLIIEDDDGIIQSWKQQLELYAVGDNPIYTITTEYAQDFRKASTLLENTVFDAAIIDIRLKTDTRPINTDGNKLLKMATNSSLTVCAVYTGEPSIVTLEEHQREFVEVFEKGNGNIETILAWLSEKSSMISAIQNMRTKMNSEMAKAFSKSIWPRWNYWLTIENTSEHTEAALIRHIATHLHASFLNQTSAVHPEEYYFIPPLQNKLDTGDVFSMEGDCYILVTPRCDLAREENPTFQLVKLTSIKDKWDQLQAIKSNSNDAKIRDIVNHGKSPKLHFIPQIKRKDDVARGPFHACFSQMDCRLASCEERASLVENRIATLSNEFVPSLVERLGAYFSRIGTPDYSHPE